MAAVELARLAQGCTLFTALGDDVFSRCSRTVLEGLGVEVRGANRAEGQRRVTTLLDGDGERTILVHGAAQEPVGIDPLGYHTLKDMDAVYFCKGDVGALQLARQAKVLVATARVLPVLKSAGGVTLDVLVRSENDEGEQFEPGDLDPPPRVEVVTNGASGGLYRLFTGEEGSWKGAALPGPLRDTYGAGDTFAAGLTYALGAGYEIQRALDFAATRAAMAVCRDGAHGGYGDRKACP